jgi:hypothetical protein
MPSPGPPVRTPVQAALDNASTPTDAHVRSVATWRALNHRRLIAKPFRTCELARVVAPR